MFICTVRASTLRMIGLLLLAAALLTGVLIYTDRSSVAAATSYRYDKVRTDGDRRDFLRQFGWEPGGEAAAAESFTVPQTFDRVLAGYNEIQKAQGLDLSRYENKKVTRYTYEITNYPGYDGKVYAHLLVHRGKIVAGDVSSADPDGFVRGLEKPTADETAGSGFLLDWLKNIGGEATEQPAETPEPKEPQDPRTEPSSGGE
ncbi:MAG: DUF4830 domain-containing protein [Clostridia bacterium]|nr:DUF4830 domain-containing protein [Clostridia bacterium]